MESKKYIFIPLILFFGIVLNGMKLSEIEGLKSLSNYDEIKNISVERIVDYDNYERNKEKDRVYVNGEDKPFTGAAIRKKNGRIIGIYTYINGKSEGKHYKYFDNGQLSLETQEKNDKAQGEGFEYYPNGKLKEKKFYKDNIVSEFIGYLQNGKLDRTFKATEGLRGIITGYYEDGIHKSCEMNVIQDYSKRGEISYIKDGESIAYDKKGRVLGIINYKDNKTTGLKQQAFKNGKLKYEYISASDKLEDLKMQDYYIEYFDNSEQIKLNCNELSKGNWRCKEYSKNGNFKREFDSPTFRSPNDWSFGINALLGMINILF
ncbi:hypothetical protein [Leptotrichia wadei]|uniref:toxin-antitoxin system YwqK family antitoxin n=1 Tax=Leptotrichia wadei TaxID=157687 RepID=UPI0028ED123D|nr:hypothetical protein [Leptotrichia wadei]